MDMSSSDVERLLQALGDQLGKAGEGCALVIVGGAALSLLGFVARTTNDIDIIARLDATGEIAPPDPLPAVVQVAILRVARDYALPSTWMNTTVGMQWRTGLPPNFEHGLTWRPFGALLVGLPDRGAMISLKLYASADQPGPDTRHHRDLLALHPTADELHMAAAWVLGQDSSAAWPEVVQRVVDHVRADAR